MPIEWLVIAAALTPQLKKYVAERAAKLAGQSAERGLAALYHRFVPEQKLLAANEAFVTRFSKEIESCIDLPTLTSGEYEKALTRFLANETVQETIQAPLDGSSELKWELLRGVWNAIRDADGHSAIELPAEFDWKKVANTYQQAIQRLMLANAELRPVMQALASIRSAESGERTARAVEQLAGPKRLFDLNRYAEAVRNAYSFLRLGSLDTEWADYERRVKLMSVYVPQSVKEALPPSDLTHDYLQLLRTESRTYGVEIDERVLEKRKREYERLLVRPLTAAVRRPAYRRVVLLGDPGLGKSSFLRYLALQWAQNSEAPVTLLIEMRKAGRMDFLEYLEKGPEPTCCLPQSELSKHLAANESLMLFDGLDEVQAGLRDEVISRIIRFSADYPLARIIVTSRIRGYYPGSVHPAQFSDAFFLHLTLQEFRPHEMAEFGRLWHLEAFQNLGERHEYQTRLQRALKDSPAIRELGANPLLLTIMAILSRNQDLPRDRALLYEKCADLLLKNWDLDKFPERGERADSRDIKDKLGPEQKMRMLEVAAASMQQERTGLAGNLIGEARLKMIVQGELEKLEVHQPWSVAEDLIWMLRERNFMLSYMGDRQYAFVHRTFLEYCCARDLRYRLEKTSSLSGQDLAALFGEHWDHDEWLEVLRLTCGLVGPEFAGACISELLNHREGPHGYRALFLASQCLREIREVGLIRSVRNDTHKYLHAIADSDPEFDARVPDLDRWALKLQAVRRTARAVREIAHGWRDDSATYSWLKHRAKDAMHSEIREVALRELVRNWSRQAEVLALTRSLAVNDQDWEVRQAAIELLVQRWRTETETMSILHDRADHDEHWSVRRAALRYLSNNWRSHPDTLRLLNAHAENDVNAEVRTWATRDIVRHFASETDVVELLKRRAILEPEWDSRRDILRELARAGRSSPQVIAFLKGIADTDPSGLVKRAVVQSIARTRGREPATQDWLRERAVADESIDVRRTAIEELRTEARNSDSVIELLKVRGTLDEYAGIRYVAIRKLAEQAQGDSDIVGWLKDRARNDEHWDVRTTALDQLASHWPADPEVAIILKECATTDEHHLVRERARRTLQQWSNEPGAGELD